MYLIFIRLLHAVLFEYLKECNSTDRSELVTTLSPLVAPLSNSKSGVKAAVMCVWHGTNKDKKVHIYKYFSLFELEKEIHK